MSDTETTTKTRGYIDLEAGTVTRDTETYSMAGVPEHAQRWLALFGLRHFVNTAKTDTIEAVMVRGELPLRKPAVKGLDDWRMAIAHAIVEQTKKTATPVLLDAAKVQAAAVTRAQLAAAKGDPTVVKHWRRLTGAPTASVLEMLAAPPAAAEPDAVMQAAE